MVCWYLSDIGFGLYRRELVALVVACCSRYLPGRPAPELRLVCQLSHAQALRCCGRGAACVDIWPTSSLVSEQVFTS